MPDDVFRIVGTTQGGSFHVERVVAEGGFSVVYRALHGAFRAPVALKCLKVPDDLSLDQRESYLERFREEAELLFRLSARIPEVVRPLHVDVIASRDGRFVPFLALEWLEGQSLADIITSRQASGAAPMGLVKIVKLVAPVARALARAHRFPGPGGRIAIVHCDLKPENVFITRLDGREAARILDYGIAMAMQSAGRKATGPVKPGEFAEPAFFTPGYAAPEQWSPRRFGPTGPRTDVWGLALMLVEAITGKSPLGDDSEAKMKAAALAEAKRPTPRALGAVVSDEVESAFAKALAVKPDARTPDVPTFWAELEQALGLPPTFVRRDERQDPEERPSWISPAPAVGAPREVPSPSALPAVTPVADPPRPEATRAPVRQAIPSLEMPKVDGAPVSTPGLKLEEPFAFDADLAAPKKRAAIDELDDLEADLEADLPMGPSPGGVAATPRANEAPPEVAARPAAASAVPRSAPVLDDVLELAPPPPSRRSGPRPAVASAAPPPASAAKAGPARQPFPSDTDERPALQIDVAASSPSRRGPPPGAAVARPHFAPPVVTSEEVEPPSLRTPVKLMATGAAIALTFFVAEKLTDAARALGQGPKLFGVGVFVIGLLLLFWRLLDR